MVKKPLVPPGEPDQLLTIAQVARMLNVSRTLIYWLIQRGDLPTLHIGHALRFRPQDVADYLQKRSVPPAPKSASKTTSRQTPPQKRMTPCSLPQPLFPVPLPSPDSSIPILSQFPFPIPNRSAPSP